MLLAIVLFVFALHIVAWMILPAARRTTVERALVRPYRQGSSLSLGELAES